MSEEHFYEQEPLKQRLLAATMEEIALHGIKDFSLRRVSSSCAVSCAAPYKHFKNRDEMILESVKLVESQWALFAKEIASQYDTDTEKELVELSLAYVRFYTGNPHYRSVLVACGRGDESREILSLVRRFCKEKKRPAEEEGIAFSLGALLYGTLAMIESKEKPNAPATYALLKEAILHLLQ